MGNSKNERPTDNSGEAVSNRKASANTPSKEITGENGEKLSGRSAEAYAVNAVTRTMSAFTQRLEQLAKKGSSLAETIGVLDNARSINNKENSEESVKKKRKDFESAMRSAILLALKMERLEQEIEQHKRNVKIADTFIDELKSGKAPELDSDGSLKDKERERLLKEYEKRTGETVDRTSIEALLVATRAQRDYELKQYEAKQSQLESLKEQSVEQAAEINELVYNDAEMSVIKEKILDLPDDQFNGVIHYLDNQEAKNKITAANEKTAEWVNQYEGFDQTGNAGKEAQDFNDDFNADNLFADAKTTEERTTSASKADGNLPIVTAFSLKGDFEKATYLDQPKPQEPNLDVKVNPIIRGLSA